MIMAVVVKTSEITISDPAERDPDLINQKHHQKKEDMVKLLKPIDHLQAREEEAVKLSSIDKAGVLLMLKERKHGKLSKRHIDL